MEGLLWSESTQFEWAYGEGVENYCWTRVLFSSPKALMPTPFLKIVEDSESLVDSLNSGSLLQVPFVPLLVMPLLVL